MAVVVGIVLGAGQSTRLGRPKQALPLGDTTLLSWVVREAEASGLDRVVVVTNGDVSPARAEVTQPEPSDTSCSTSIRSGLAVAGECGAVMLLLGDMPGVDASVIDAVRAEWEARRPWALRTRYDDGIGHPLVFAADALRALRALHGDRGVWMLLEAEPDRVEEARVARLLPLDVDTWDDYEAVVRALG